MNSSTALFFVNQPSNVVEQFRTWLGASSLQCVVVEPVNRSFSLIVRDNPWGVVLNLDNEDGRKLCSQIRSDELLESVRVIALSSGGNNSALTEHMFSEASADVYGKLPLEDGILDQWLHKQLDDLDLDTNPLEIELTPDLRVASKSKDAVPEVRLSRLERELFEQSEKLATTSRTLLRSNLALQEAAEQNADLKSECERLTKLVQQGLTEEVAVSEMSLLQTRLKEAEDRVQQLQDHSTVEVIDKLDSLSKVELLQQLQTVRNSRDEKVAQINTLHGELQLTRQAVNSLKNRTQKAEERLTESQDVSVLREQQVQRDLMNIQRQLSSNQRNLELSSHRESQLMQQIESMRTRLDQSQEAFEAERNQWIQQLDVDSEAKQQDLLLEIEGLTEALQAQLLDGDSEGAEQVVRDTLQRRLQEKQQELEDTTLRIELLETQNRNLQEQVSQATDSMSVNQTERQEMLNTAYRDLQNAQQRQQELENQLHEFQSENASVDSWLVEKERLLEQINSMGSDSLVELQERLSTMESERSDLENQQQVWVQEQQKFQNEMEQMQTMHDTMVTQLEDQILQLQKQTITTDSVSGFENPNHLQLALQEAERLRLHAEESLEKLQNDIGELTTERGVLELALADSQAMTDVIESASETEVKGKDVEIQDLHNQLIEASDKYLELENQTAIVISERDEMWAQVEYIQQRQGETEKLLEVEKEAKDVLLDDKSKLENHLIELEQLHNESQRILEEERTRFENVETESREQMLLLEEDSTSVKQSLAELESDHQLLKQSLSELETDSSSLSVKLTELTQEKEHLQNVILESEKTIQELNETKVTLETECSDLEGQFDQLNAKVVELESSLVESKEVKDNFEQQLQSVQSQLSESLEKIESFNEEVEQLKDVLNETQVAINQKEESVQQLQAEKTALEVELNQVLEKGELVDTVFNERVNAFEIEINGYQNRIEQLENELSEHAEDLQSRNEQLRSQVESSESQYSKELKHSKEQIVELEESLQQVQASLLVAQERSEKLQERVDDLTDKEQQLTVLEKQWSDASGRILELEQSLENIAVENVPTTLGQSEGSQIAIAELTEQRALLLEERDQLKEVQAQQEQRLQELLSSSDDTLVQVQDQRYDALAELEMVQLELGIAQSTSRQIAQQAEQIRDRAIENETRWKQQLSEKESEIRRLRDTLQKMERGLSAVFVKHPHM